LVELLVVIAIIGILVALLLPAVQAAREAARRSQCVNNLRQLAVAMLNYESAYKGLPPMARNWTNADVTAYYHGAPGTIGTWYDDHGWYLPVMPFMEESGVADLANPDKCFSDPSNRAAREAFVPMLACPSDLGLQKNEWNSSTWSRVRGNYVVNAGNTVYGQHYVGNCPGAFPDCIEFLGAPFIPRKMGKLSQITDGTSNTLMMSEVLVLPATILWSGPYSDGQTALGGQTFTGFHTPNSPLPDALARQSEWWTNERAIPGWIEQNLPVNASGTPDPPVSVSGGRRGAPALPPDATTDSNGMKQQHIAARSKHPGGVNASRCDGSVEFYTDAIDRRVWNALTSAAGEEVFNRD
jgi:prepilin-type processing-associated H-X9-DG protein